LHRSDSEELLRALNLFDARFRKANVPDFALPLRLLKKSELIVFRYCRIDSVQLIEIDPIDSQPAKAAVKFLAQSLRPAIDLPLAGPGTVEAALRGNDEM
jgi:hypothetical protein